MKLNTLKEFLVCKTLCFFSKSFERHWINFTSIRYHKIFRISTTKSLNHSSFICILTQNIAETKYVNIEPVSFEVEKFLNIFVCLALEISSIWILCDRLQVFECSVKGNFQHKGLFKKIQRLSVNYFFETGVYSFISVNYM